MKSFLLYVSVWIYLHCQTYAALNECCYVANPHYIDGENFFFNVTLHSYFANPSSQESVVMKFPPYYEMEFQPGYSEGIVSCTKRGSVEYECITSRARNEIKFSVTNTSEPYMESLLFAGTECDFREWCSYSSSDPTKVDTPQSTPYMEQMVDFAGMPVPRWALVPIILGIGFGFALVMYFFLARKNGGIKFDKAFGGGQTMVSSPARAEGGGFKKGSLLAKENERQKKSLSVDTSEGDGSTGGARRRTPSRSSPRRQGSTRSESNRDSMTRGESRHRESPRRSNTHHRDSPSRSDTHHRDSPSRSDTHHRDSPRRGVSRRDTSPEPSSRRGKRTSTLVEKVDETKNSPRRR